MASEMRGEGFSHTLNSYAVAVIPLMVGEFENPY